MSAAASWGVPHPPGTPLYVTIARAWMLAFGMLSPARAVNLLSAFATALAAGVLVWISARSTMRVSMGVAAGLCAGGMSTVWSSATETEVYAVALLLAMLMLLAAFNAGRAHGSARWISVVAYAMGLAAAVHPMSLVAGPAAIVLARRKDESWKVPFLPTALLLCLFVIALGVTLVLAQLIGVGLVGLAVVAWRGTREERRITALALFAMLLAASAIAILPLRAAHHPMLNEGNAYGWAAWREVMMRYQYPRPGIWPRQAPVWLQFLQFFEYMDWQVALGLTPGAAPSLLRTPFSVLFLILGVIGGRAHRRADPALWSALAMLFACASAGLVIYLNFRPGYSLGYGIVADDVAHEVRERDYFFLFAFWAWGAWAGMGAVSVLSRWGKETAIAGAALAAMPLSLNWSAMDRARGAERDAAPTVMRALLWGVPPRAMMFTAGDDDTYLLWYAQVVGGARRDASVVPYWMLGVTWLDDQVRIRDSIEISASDHPRRELADRARQRGRPVAASIGFDSAMLAELGGPWMLRGLTFVAADSSAIRVGSGMPLVDTTAARAFVREFGVPALPPAGAIDPTARMELGFVGCPARYLARSRGAAPVDSLDSRCKLR